MYKQIVSVIIVLIMLINANGIVKNPDISQSSNLKASKEINRKAYLKRIKNQKYLALPHIKDDKLRNLILNFLIENMDKFSEKEIINIKNLIESIIDKNKSEQYKMWELYENLNYRTLESIISFIYGKQNLEIDDIYANSNSITKKISRKKIKLEENLEHLIGAQANKELQCIIEALINGKDAVLKQKGKGVIVGRFGMGFLQILQLLKQEGDKIVLRTKVEGLNYRTELIFKLAKGEIYIKDTREQVNLEDKKKHYTKICIETKQISKKYDEIRDILNNLRYEKELEITLEEEQNNGAKKKIINDLKGYKNIKGNPAEYLIKEKDLVKIRLANEKVYIEDKGCGLKDWRKLIIPGYSDKKIGEGGEYIIYKNKSKESDDINSKIILKAGSYEETLNIKSMNLPEELIIYLPQELETTEARNEIQYNKAVIEGLYRLTTKILKSKNKHKLKLINGILKVLNYIQSIDKTDKLKDEIYRVEGIIEEWIKNYRKAIILPDKELFKNIEIKSNKAIEYVDERVIEAIDIGTIPGIEKIKEFDSAEYTAYTVSFKQELKLKEKGIQKIGKILLVDKELYDKCKRANRLEYLNLRLNFYIDYGPVPEEYGIFKALEDLEAEKKQRNDMLEQSSDQEKNKAIQIANIPSELKISDKYEDIIKILLNLGNKEKDIIHRLKYIKELKALDVIFNHERHDFDEIKYFTVTAKGDLYFIGEIDDKYAIYKKREDGGNVEKITGNFNEINDFKVTAQGDVYFIGKIDDKYAIYKKREDEKKAKKLSADFDWIYSFTLT
ncbi:hypothetical protein ACFL5N_02320, partial [bacterium]